MYEKYRLDRIDREILNFLIENARTPFTEIAKHLNISAGTVHIRVKKLESSGIVRGTSLVLDYQKLGYSFIMYVGVNLDKTHHIRPALEALEKLSYVTVVHITTGQMGLFCKIRARDSNHARDILFEIGEIEGVTGTNTTISLEESINDKNRLIKKIFSE